MIQKKYQSTDVYPLACGRAPHWTGRVVMDTYDGSRHPNHVLPRRAASVVLVQDYGKSLWEAARLVGYRSHSTVVDSLRSYREMDEDILSAVHDLRYALGLLPAKEPAA